MAMLDHLQFGSPEDPHIFWAFQETVRALRDYATAASIPCIGGKVSLYNGTDRGPIKPSPVVLVMGLADHRPAPAPPRPGDTLFVVGTTGNEMGGSAYCNMYGYREGRCPRVDANTSVRNAGAVRSLVDAGLARCVHDCSQGGLAVAAAHLCIEGMTGCEVDMDMIPRTTRDPSALLFSESHCRYLVVSRNAGDTAALLEGHRVPHAAIGTFGGDALRMGPLACIMVDKARELWSGVLGGILDG